MPYHRYSQKTGRAVPIEQERDLNGRQEVGRQRVHQGERTRSTVIDTIRKSIALPISIHTSLFIITPNVHLASLLESPRPANHWSRHRVELVSSELDSPLSNRAALINQTHDISPCNFICTGWPHTHSVICLSFSIIRNHVVQVHLRFSQHPGCSHHNRHHSHGGQSCHARTRCSRRHAP